MVQRLSYRRVGQRTPSGEIRPAGGGRLKPSIVRIPQDDILTIDGYCRIYIQILTPKWLLTPRLCAWGVGRSRAEGPGGEGGQGEQEVLFVTFRARQELEFDKGY